MANKFTPTGAPSIFVCLPNRTQLRLPPPSLEGIPWGSHLENPGMHNIYAFTLSIHCKLVQSAAAAKRVVVSHPPTNSPYRTGIIRAEDYWSKLNSLCKINLCLIQAETAAAASTTTRRTTPLKSYNFSIFFISNSTPPSTPNWTT